MSADRSCRATIHRPEAAFTQIDAGAAHAMAFDADGVVWSWGDGRVGQVDMPSGVGFAVAAAGRERSLGLACDGRAWAWGGGTSRALGTGLSCFDPVESRPLAVEKPEDVTFTLLAAGSNASCALDQDGRAWAWGHGDRSGLGTASKEDALKPTLVAMPSGVTFADITAGHEFEAAPNECGSAWTWGSAYDGQLGSGTFGYAANHSAPVPFGFPTGMAWKTSWTSGPRTEDDEPAPSAMIMPVEALP